MPLQVMPVCKSRLTDLTPILFGVSHDVLFQIYLVRKTFLTKHTLIHVWFLFVVSHDVLFQISVVRKTFLTKLTLK